MRINLESFYLTDRQEDQQERIAVSDTLDNGGIVTAAASTSRYYLSVDQARSAGDVLLTGKRAVPQLAPSVISTGTAALTIPTSATDGAYYGLACADDLAKVKETTDANNCASTSTTVRVGWPDLVITNINDPPAIVTRGGKFTVSDTVLNQGTIPAGNFYVRYALSTGAVRHITDPALAGARTVLGLYAGASSAGSRVVVVPSTTPTGTYFVLACADETNKVPEQNDANNCRSSQALVTVR